MSYEVQIEDLRDSATASGAAASQAVRAEPDSAVRQAAPGIPGAASVPWAKAVNEAAAGSVAEVGRGCRPFAAGGISRSNSVSVSLMVLPARRNRQLAAGAAAAAGFLFLLPLGRPGLRRRPPQPES